jgi:hypothetical protein
MIPPMGLVVDWLEAFVTKINSNNNIGCINFVASRQTFSEFKRKNKELISKAYEELSNLTLEKALTKDKKKN